MDLVLDARGHYAGVQPNRHEENLVERKPLCTIQRVADLRLESAFFAYRMPRKAGHKKVRGFNGLFDRSRPVLARQQPAAIQPGLESVSLQRLENPLGRHGVLLHISHEHLRPVARQEPEAPLRVGYKRAQTIDLHGGAFGQALPDQAA